MYYLRTKPAAAAIQFTVDKLKMKALEEVKGEREGEESNGKDNGEASSSKDAGGEEDAEAAAAARRLEEIAICSRENKDACLACGS